MFVLKNYLKYASSDNQIYYQMRKMIFCIKNNRKNQFS
ncbi:hypothetical protein CLS_22820 [[Clostridium] cf. saccharolyticum K10]|nr:hypothetical protein CLS_22820 [[Clostridium] cf. saccharolyticum K10]